MGTLVGSDGSEWEKMFIFAKLKQTSSIKRRIALGSVGYNLVVGTSYHGHYL